MIYVLVNQIAIIDTLMFSFNFINIFLCKRKINKYKKKIEILESQKGDSPLSNGYLQTAQEHYYMLIDKENNKFKYYNSLLKLFF